MNDQPRTAYAALNHKVHLHAPARCLPIIIVPGIMGSRLTDPVTDKLAWNPTGLPLGAGPGVFTVDYDRLAQTSAALVPDETHGFDADDPQAKEFQGIRHYANLVLDFYGKLMRELNALATPLVADYQVKPRIYCCGYDWRLDVAQSASRLAQVVQEALQETRERKVILVAHSMGGLVSRYYCRVLGGESSVHRLFLLGSPTLGAPTAYMQLKNGVPGLYVKDFLGALQNHDGAAMLAEGIQEAAAVESVRVAAVSGSPSGAKRVALGILGDVYLALCLGAGRWLQRQESLVFARQLPAIYELLPNALYCREHPHWVLFDPATTGIPPTGYMILLPTLFDLIADAAGDAFQAFFHRNAAVPPANSQTLAERLQSIALLLGGQSAPVPAGQPPGEPVTHVVEGMQKFAELMQRLRMTFRDCVSNRRLYEDIYTGLWDVVEHRPLCAANLSLAYRCDEALTLNPYKEEAVSALGEMADKLILPFLLLGLVKVVIDFVDSINVQSAAIRTHKRAQARVYMHPNTVAVFCDTEEVASGAMLIPTDIASNNDANVVRWMMLPSSLGEPFFMAMTRANPGSRLGAQVLGDGTVPAASANPPSHLLATPFRETHKVARVLHNDLTSDPQVLDYLKDTIDATLPTFLES